MKEDRKFTEKQGEPQDERRGPWDIRVFVFTSPFRRVRGIVAAAVSLTLVNKFARGGGRTYKVLYARFLKRLATLPGRNVGKPTAVRLRNAP